MNIFVKESVSITVARLRQAEFKVDFDETRGDEANGYVTDKNKERSNEILAIISDVNRWRRKMPDWDIPPEANACIQIVNEESIQPILSTVEQRLTVDSG
jgi:hypothetical protein